jgi:predicted short-subunit dehydrogenase-like oxidoreductase (DUF2520 family)
MPKRDLVAIVGAGGLARALARALAAGGKTTVTVAARRPAAAAQAVRGVRGARAVRLIEDAVSSADIVILAVTDASIARVAQALVPMRSSWRGVVALHAAGAYGPELLAPLRAAGAATGVLHPLAVLGSRREPALTGSYARVEGDTAARTAARRLCAVAGLIPLRGARLGSPAGRASYHAAASLASNDVVALLAAAAGLLTRHGVSRRDAIAALTALASGALAQVQAFGLEAALTGPVARGDAATLKAQLRALAAADPDAAAAHRGLSMTLVELALAAGRIDRKTARGLRAALARGPGRSRTV